MCNGKIVLYITFIDFDSIPGSGSAVRPMRMYEAFIAAGYEVKLVCGVGNKRNIRKKSINEIRAWLKENRPDFCYIEPPSGPLFFYCDRALISFLNKMKVPMGFFYRDLYWKFQAREFEDGVEKWRDKIKHWLICRMQHRDFRLIKNNIHQIYFTSHGCNKFMGLKDYEILPPGCTENIMTKRDNMPSRAIYVGGATIRYGLGLVLDSCLVVREKIDIKLQIVCPKNQWEKWVVEFPQYKVLPEWVTVHHIGDGVELEELYLRSDFALVPILKTCYNDLALPIKLFEYISRLLPVVVTKCDAMVEFLEPYEIGYLSGDNVEEYSAAIFQMITDQKLYNEFKKNLVEVRHNNLWTKRVDKIAKDLGRYT